MHLNKVLVKKVVFILLPILICIAILVALGFSLRSMQSRNSSIDSKLKDLESRYAKASQENIELKGNNIRAEENYAALKKDFDALTADRNNLLIQLKGLLADRSLARELEGSVDKYKKDIEALTKEKQELSAKIDELRSQMEKLGLAHAKAVKEKEQLAMDLARERDTSLLKRLEENKLTLQKENEKLSAAIRQSTAKAQLLQDDIARLNLEWSRSKQEKAQLQTSLDGLNKKYVDALQKNKNLEQKIIQEPAKFAEIARQNKLLIKETANMHYNLGVFYTKNKEYSRAIAEYEKAIELTPGDAYAHFNLGYIYAEYLVDRPKAIDHFKQYLRLAKREDKDVDWVKNYILTWESWEGKKPLD